MAVKIEILAQSADFAKVAFYYPVPQSIFLAASVDPDRKPEGTNLSAQELLDLQKGVLYEHVVKYPINGRTQQEILTELEVRYAKEAKNASDNYKKRFGPIFVNDGTYFDGTTWT